MGLKRQLQIEIDRCLKRVTEAQADFQELWLKLEQMEKAPKPVKLDVPAPQYSHACNKDAAAREKMLSELKKHLKRMQRLREQIRSWLMASDTKDAEGLPEARRAIEVDMERFKVCEKQNKTKAYSKVGLLREEKVDPAEIAREETTEWLNSVVAKLEALVDDNEAEIEEIAAGEGGRGRKPANPSPRAEELMSFINRHKSHIVRLEQVLRLVGNDQVAPADVEDSLRDGLEYYLESSTEPDFQQDDDDLFASIPLLSEVDENIGKIVSPTLDRIRSSPTGDPTEIPGDKAAASAPLSVTTPTSDNKPARQTKSAKRAARAAATADVGGTRKSRTEPSSPRTPPGQAPKFNASATPLTAEEGALLPKTLAWSTGGAAQSTEVSTPLSTPDKISIHQHQDDHVAAATAVATPDSSTVQLPQQPQNVPINTRAGGIQQKLKQQQQDCAPAVSTQLPALEKTQPLAARHTEAQGPPESYSKWQHSSTALSEPRPVPLPPPSFVRTREGVADLTPTSSFAQALLLSREAPLHDSQPLAQSDMDSHPQSRQLSPSDRLVGLLGHDSSAACSSSDAVTPRVPRLLKRPRTSSIPRPGSPESEVSLLTSSAVLPELSVPRHPSKPVQAHDDDTAYPKTLTDNHAVDGRGARPAASSNERTPISHGSPPDSTPSTYMSEVEAADEAPCVSPTEGESVLTREPLLDAVAEAEPLATPLMRAPLKACPPELRADLLELLDASMRFGPTSCDAHWPSHGDTGKPASDCLRPPKVLQRPLNHHATRNVLLLPNALLPQLQQPAAFCRLSEDTLFFAFYFQQGLINQFYAADELRRRGFVLNKNLNIWFKQTGELLKSTETLEQGTFDYFDYELRSPADGWTKRTTQTDFQFPRKHACSGHAPKSAA